MTSRERLLTVMKGGIPDCVPVAPDFSRIVLKGNLHTTNVMLRGTPADAEAARMLVGGARWLIRNTYDAKSGFFRYTTCEKRTKGGNFQKTQWVLEGLADAFALSRDEEIGGYLRDGLKAIGQFPDWLDHLGLGKAMAMQMRYVPGIQAALNSHIPDNLATVQESRKQGDHTHETD